MNKQLAILTLATLASLHAEPSETAMRQSATKAVQLMERSVGALAPNIPCASCHHNNMPLWAFSVAKDHGIPVDAALSKTVAIKSYGFLKDIDRAVQGTAFVDPALEGGQMLAFAKAAGVEPSLTTALHVRRNATHQREDGRWVTFDARPPHSSSVFMATALNIKALADHMPESLSAERDARIAKARAWLINTQPASTDDHAFRLFGLLWSGASKKDLQTAAKALLDEQHADGSWTQVKGRNSDAYATGEALTALKLSGTAPASAYARGVEWLLKNQLEDGSWLVKTRLHEVAPISPPYMETGFPHGRNQIVSMVGTTWAMMALALGLPEQLQPRQQITEVRPAVEPWMQRAFYGGVNQLEASDINLKTPGGSTLLMFVANDAAKVSKLIGFGANVTDRSKSGQTALMVAATYNRSSNVLRQLIAQGADAKPAKDVEFNASPLVMATYAGDVEAIRILLEAGADPKQTMMLQGLVPMNPVSASIHLDEPAMLSEYLKRAISPDMIDEVPLISLAAISNRPAVAKVLIDAGADLNFRDKFGWTPLRHARAIEHDVPQVELLLQAALEKRNVNASRK